MHTTARIRKLLFALMAILVSATASARDRSGELQQLVDDVHTQLELVARFDVATSLKRYGALENAIAEWQNSARGDEEFAIMERWLQQALRASMPGSRASMPPAPAFVRAEAEEVLPAGDVQPPPTPTFVPADRTESIDEPIPETARPAPVVPSQQDNMWANHAARRPIRIDKSDPFVDDPLVAAPAVTEIETNTNNADRPSAPAARLASLESQPRVNLAELTARTTGYERGLRAVTARLTRDRELTSVDLLVMARELQQLDVQREFIALYVDTLGDGEAAGVGQLTGLNGVKKLLTERIEQVQLRRSNAAADPALEAARGILNSL